MAMKIILVSKLKLSRSAIIIPLTDGKQQTWQQSWSWFTSAQRKLLRQFVSSQCTGAEGEIQSMTLPYKTGLLTVIFIGLGKLQSYSLRKLRLRIRQLVQQANGLRLEKIVLSLKDIQVKDQNLELQVQQLAEAALMSEYRFSKFKSGPSDKKLKTLELVVNHTSISTLHHALKIGQLIGTQVNEVRELSNTPGGDMTPKVLATRAKQMAKESGAQFEVFGEAKMKRLGMWGILGVSRGSGEEAQFITVKHLGGPKKQPPIVLVGKGITFDSGGLNLKTGNHMDGMHLDMSGAASVIGAVSAAARLKLPVNVIALAPAAENMPSGQGYRPGDVLKTMGGKTIEVKNTDAEGRIVLADALCYAKQFKPKLVIDVATLTGVAWVALGYRASAYLTTEDGVAHALEHAAEDSGDYIWRFPLWEEYAAEVKGTFGDLQNTSRYPVGGVITAAHFLKAFTDGYPWVHIDIAPTMEAIDDMFLSKGSTGAATRLLIHLLRASA